MALTVGDIMDAEPVTASPEDDVETVVRLLRRHELHGVPVVNDVGRLVGIVTEADLVLTDGDADLYLPHYIELMGGIVFLERLRGFEAKLRKAAALKAKDLMTPNPLTIDARVGIHEAGRIIVDRGHNRLPVVEHGRLVGVVTRLDILEALTREE
jgi:CBS domain-containing protein